MKTLLINCISLKICIDGWKPGHVEEHFSTKTNKIYKEFAKKRVNGWKEEYNFNNNKKTMIYQIYVRLLCVCYFLCFFYFIIILILNVYEKIFGSMTGNCSQQEIFGRMAGNGSQQEIFGCMAGNGSQ